jgi:serine/threonine protein kinase
LAEPFIAALESPSQFDRDWPELMDSIRRLKESRMGPAGVPAAAIEEIGDTPLGRGGSSLVRLVRRADGTLSAVKTATTERAAKLIGREAVIHRGLNHPLVIGFRGFHGHKSPVEIETEFAPNGSLADHLPGLKSSVTTSPNRIAKIIVGIVLGMAHVHSRGVIHRDLCPGNILIDWDWNPRIADFGHSISPEFPEPLSVSDPSRTGIWPSVDCHYIAPECYDHDYGPKCDVFSFGLILFELLVGDPGFPRDWKTPEVAKMIAIDEYRPIIPECERVNANARALITACWAQDPDNRPSFKDILGRLEGMDFEVVPGVRGAKIAGLVDEIRKRAGTRP